MLEGCRICSRPGSFLDSARAETRLAVEEHRADDVTEALEGTGGVHRIVALSPERTGTGAVLAADVTPAVADRVMEMIHGVGGNERTTRHPAGGDRSAPHGHGRFRGEEEFAWVEVMGEARSTPAPRALPGPDDSRRGGGRPRVIRDNLILIVGGDGRQPRSSRSALCVGIVGRRIALARRAGTTPLLGLLLVAGVGCGLAALLDATNVIDGVLRLGAGGLESLGTTDYSTVLIALAAGMAAMLSFETRAAAAVGVAISVTTIPAHRRCSASRLGLGTSTRWRRRARFSRSTSPC